MKDYWSYIKEEVDDDYVAYDLHYQPVLTKFQLKVGDIIKHPVFGVGRIMSQRDDKEIIKVKFNNLLNTKDLRVEQIDNLKKLKRNFDDKEEQEPRVRWFKAGKLVKENMNIYKGDDGKQYTDDPTYYDTILLHINDGGNVDHYNIRDMVEYLNKEYNGRRVEFTSIVKENGAKKGLLKNILVESVEIRIEKKFGSKILHGFYFYDKEGNEHLCSVKSKIRRFKEINPMDPYGEEDWTK